jgi:hypothetical protein
MSRTHGTSSGGVCRLASASSCAFGVVSFKFKTCSSWSVLVSSFKSLFKSKSCQIKPRQRTSELTGQHPRISVSTSHTSAQSHCDRPSNFVPGPLPHALAHSTGNARPCVREHGRAMHGSSVVRLRSPCEVGRELFLPLR